MSGSSLVDQSESVDGLEDQLDQFNLTESDDNERSEGSSL